MTNREIAISIWGVIFLLLAFYLTRKQGTMKGATSVLGALWKVIILPISQWAIIFNIITIATVYFLVKDKIELSYWYIKDYLLVFSFTVFPIILLLQKKSILDIFREKTREIFALLSILLFLGNTYTFSLIIEIILVFFLGVISIFSAIADTKNEFYIASRIFSFLLSIIGFVLLLGAMNNFLKNISDICTIDFWLSYAFELVVILLNTPMLYIAQKMIIIEKMIAHSDYPNTILSFLKFYWHSWYRKIKFKRLRVSNQQNLNVTVEKFYFGYPKITVHILDNTLRREEVLNIIANIHIYKDKILSNIYKVTQFPIYIEINNNDNQTIALWKEDFLSKSTMVYDPFLDKQTEEIYPSTVMLVNKKGI